MAAIQLEGVYSFSSDYSSPYYYFSNYSFKFLLNSIDSNIGDGSLSSKRAE